MAAFVKFYPFVEAVAEKAHNLGADQLTIALCPSANQPAQTNAALSELTQIAYTNLSTRNVTTSSSLQTTGLYKLICADLIITASGGPSAAFRWVVLYNDTSITDLLISYYDYGLALTLADGESFTVDFDGTNGVLTIQ